MSDSRLRIAIVNSDRCRPKKCKQECKKNCPVVRTGKKCIEVSDRVKVAVIHESLCIGCGICVKKCPFDAIQIINLPKDLSKETTHRYGINGFKLHRLPMPKAGSVLGLVGTNGIGKSTALKILSGKLKPNLGRFQDPPDWQEILVHFRGSTLQNYFTQILEDRIKAAVKPQYVDVIARQVKGNVRELIERKDERGIAAELCKQLELDHLLDRQIQDLSGGELQRFSICLVCCLNCNVYMFDEPSSYLDVRQRLKTAKILRQQLIPSDLDAEEGRKQKYVIVVEHDLSVLDYLSDQVCCLWGEAGAYGVVTFPAPVRDGINMFLEGFVRSENLKFRDSPLTFKTNDGDDRELDRRAGASEYVTMTKTMGSFRLDVEGGKFNSSECVVLLGENGTGKTTLIRLLAGYLSPDNSELSSVSLSVSVKPQTIAPKFEGSVQELLEKKIPDSMHHEQFNTDVMRPLQITRLMQLQVQTLSGGELQRVALALALGKPANVYLIDEPSAYLDVEQRIVASRVIKRFIVNAKKTAFIVEHDFIMASYLADSVIVYDGVPGVHCKASEPQSLVRGMNQFLRQMEITFRRDPTNFRPRINKLDSQKDREQKLSGNHFLLEE